MNIRYLPVMKSALKKTATKKLHGITTEQHLNFNEYITIYARMQAENLMHCRGCLLLFAVNRKRCVKHFHQWTIKFLSSYLDVYFYVSQKNQTTEGSLQLCQND